MADVQLNPNQQLLVDLGIRDIEEFTSTQEDNQSQEPSESSEEMVLMIPLSVMVGFGFNS